MNQPEKRHREPLAYDRPAIEWPLLRPGLARATVGNRARVAPPKAPLRVCKSPLRLAPQETPAACVQGDVP